MGVVDSLSFDVQGAGGSRPFRAHSDRQKIGEGGVQK